LVGRPEEKSGSLPSKRKATVDGSAAASSWPTTFPGPVIVMTGRSVVEVKLTIAGVGSMPPSSSIARTQKVWVW